MSFRLGLVGLCTSHPGNWVPIIGQLAAEGLVDVEVVAAWDSGETRPAGFAETFCQEFAIPAPITDLGDMVDQVDGVIVHTANWDRHLAQARPFIDAGKSVLLDKPMVGRMRDIEMLRAWAAAGKRVTGGSSLRYAREVRDYLARPEAERGRPHTVFAGCGTDPFNYGIHAYSLLSAILGPGVCSVRYLGTSALDVYQMNWSDGRIGLLTIGTGPWLPFHASVVTTRGVEQIKVEPRRLYRSLLEQCLPYLCGQTDAPPLPMEELIEPEWAALAAAVSRRGRGEEVRLDAVPPDDPGYDGQRFAADYRRAREA